MFKPEIVEKINGLMRQVAADEFANPETYCGYRENAEQHSKYHAVQDALEARFKREALAAVGLQEHVKADKIYDYAWKRGHANGLGVVLDELIDLAVLFHDD